MPERPSCGPRPSLARSLLILLEGLAYALGLGLLDVRAGVVRRHLLARCDVLAVHAVIQRHLIALKLPVGLVVHGLSFDALLLGSRLAIQFSHIRDQVSVTLLTLAIGVNLGLELGFLALDLCLNLRFDHLALSALVFHRKSRLSLDLFRAWLLALRLDGLLDRLRLGLGEVQPDRFKPCRLYKLRDRVVKVVRRDILHADTRPHGGQYLLLQ